MATEQLLVRLSMDARQYKQEARSAATATGGITTSARTLETSTGRARGAMSGLATTAKFAIAGVATAAVVGFAKSSVRAAVDLQESINAVNVVFGESADEILAIGESAADSFGLAQAEFQGFAVRFSNFAEVIARESGDTIPDVIEGLTGRIADFASVMNIDVPEAADKFQSALAGQSRPIAEYGIDVRDAAVQQKALELGIVDVGETMSQQEKEFVRYRILMDETADSAGDFANTQDDLANATRTLDANLEDLKAKFGASITPALAEATATGIRFLDVLDPDVNLGWTQRLSAGLQLVLGDGADAVEVYIEQKEALNDLAEGGDALSARIVEAFGATRDPIQNFASDVDDAGDAAGDAEGPTSGLAGALYDTQANAAEAATALGAMETALHRLLDPAFRALDDQRALNKATEDYANIDAETPVAERTQIIQDLITAQQQADTSAREAQEGIGLAGQAIEATGEKAGIAQKDIDLLTGDLEALDGGLSVYELEVLFTASGSAAARQAIENSGGYGSGRVDVRGNQRAHGGPVSRDTPYIVGERGPEMFVPGQSGYVLSNNDMSSLLAGVGSTHNYNIPIQQSGNPSVDTQLAGHIVSVLRRMESI